jgi:hypothetical protein
MKITFLHSGTYNSKTSWNGYDGETLYTIRWNSTLQYDSFWEIDGWLYDGEPRNYTTEDTPISGWTLYNAENHVATFDVNLGPCPTATPTPTPTATPTATPTPTPTPTPTEVECVSSFTITEVFDPSNVVVNYEIYKVNSSATGYVTDGTTNAQTLRKTITNNASITITGVTTNGTSFLGWSSVKGEGNLIQTNPIFTHNPTNNTTYYAIIKKASPISKDFCYYPNGSDLNDICLACLTTRKVYYNATDYVNDGFESIDWYQDENLTIPADNGFYKESDTNVVTPIIYQLTSGSPTKYGLCGPAGFIYCD